MGYEEAKKLAEPFVISLWRKDAIEDIVTLLLSVNL